MNIKTIAMQAGVSPATVSLVLNNKAGVSDERRREIQALLDLHGYVRKGSGKAGVAVLLVKYLTHGTVVEHNGDFINQVLGGLEAEVDELKVKLTTRTIFGGNYDSILGSFRNGEFHGAIIVATEMDPSFIKELANTPIPVVALDNTMEGVEVDSVVMDNRGGVLAAVQYLVDKGHRRIGFIKSKLQVSNFEMRFQGYLDALRANNIDYNADDVFEVMPTMGGSYEDLLALIAQRPDLPTAFFASNDLMGVGLIKALKKRQYAVPDQVSVIGFDDLHFCTVSEPMLTTMAVAKETMGRLAVRRIYDRITTGGTHDCVKTMLFPRLVERESIRDLTGSANK